MLHFNEMIHPAIDGGAISTDQIGSFIAINILTNRGNKLRSCYGFFFSSFFGWFQQHFSAQTSLNWTPKLVCNNNSVKISHLQFFHLLCVRAQIPLKYTRTTTQSQCIIYSFHSLPFTQSFFIVLIHLKGGIFGFFHFYTMQNSAFAPFSLAAHINKWKWVRRLLIDAIIVIVSSTIVVT